MSKLADKCRIGWVSRIGVVAVAMLAGACQPEGAREPSTQRLESGTAALNDGDPCVPDWTSCRDIGLCGPQFDGCRIVNCGPCTCTSIPCTDWTFSCELPPIHCYAEGTDCCGYGL